MATGKLDRVQDLYTSDRAVADRSIKWQSQFIQDNMDALQASSRTPFLLNKCNEIHAKLLNNGVCDENERNYIQEAYERVWKGLGYESVATHQDRRRKGLRYG